MKPSSPARHPLSCVFAAALAAAHGLAFAQADAPAQNIVIRGSRDAAPAAPVPATTEAVTALQLDEVINTPTTAGALQYLPSVHVRERYVGDRNGVLVMRVNSSIASAQTTVYADGLLLSNFLNNSFSTAPRWGLVTPEEIERIDVIYGPYSALYPGNSAGGVVRIATRMPTRFEAHAKLDLFTQRFREYGTDDRFNGSHASASLGVAQGPFSAWLALDHLANHGQPQTFGNTTAKTGAPAAAGSFTVVDASRVFRDIDTSGNPRIIVSSTGIDHTVQDLVKLKLGMELAPGLNAKLTLASWSNASDTSVDSDLRDAAGNTVFNAGSTVANPLKFVRIDGADYTVSSAAPSRARSEHRLHGLELATNTGGAWDLEFVASQYEQRKDTSRSAVPTNGYDNGYGSTPTPGQLTDAAGTGWHHADLRGQWRLGRGTGAHTLAWGLHHDRYTLVSVTSNVADWLGSTTGTLNTNSYGRTRTQALYLQDEWRVADAWTLAFGGRHEHWKAYDGSNFNAANTGVNPKNLVYADRSYSHFSPKAFASWQPAPAWTLRGSVGKATRYPTVQEMFQTFNGPGGIRFNDPSLRPERVLSTEWVAEQKLDTASWLASLFTEHKTDALISQTDVTVTPNISSIQNVDRVKTRGLEWVGQAADVGVRGLDLNGSVTYTRSKITADTRNPGLEGTDQPRIPRWRATAVVTWRATEQLSASLAYRFSGHQHNAVYNTALGRYNDVNPDVYGAVSRYSVFDTKLLWRIDRQWSASLGINNLGNFKYYVNPNPYPQRTGFATVKYDL